MFLEPDPTLPIKYEGGVVWIQTETRHNKCTMRHRNHLGTRYDPRNDPTWHFKNKQVFSLAAITTTVDDGVEVATLDELNVKGKDGQPLTHQFLMDHLDILNGKKLIGSFSGVSSAHRQNQGQRGMTRLLNKQKEKGTYSPVAAAEARERRQVLDKFDRAHAGVSWFENQNVIIMIS